jgi:hypothetical protein
MPLRDSLLMCGASIVIACATSGCGNGHMSPSSSRFEVQAVRVVRDSRIGRDYRRFPSRPLTRQCVIFRGGAPPPLKISARCTTTVRFPKDDHGTAIVTFRQEWPRSAHGSHARRHWWRFVVTPAGHVRLAGEGGFPPPQRVA